MIFSKAKVGTTKQGMSRMDRDNSNWRIAYFFLFSFGCLLVMACTGPTPGTKDEKKPSSSSEGLKEPTSGLERDGQEVTQELSQEESNEPTPVQDQSDSGFETPHEPSILEQQQESTPENTVQEPSTPEVARPELSNPPETPREQPGGGDAPVSQFNKWFAAKATYKLPAFPNHPSLRWSRSDGFCGSVFRTKTNTVLFRSGVATAKRRKGICELYPGYYSNAMMEWNPRTNEVKAIDVLNWGGGSYGGGCLVPGFKSHPTPSPRHTYDGMAYIPKTDTVYLVLGATWKITTKATQEANNAYNVDMKSTWKYDITKKRWSRINGSVRSVFKRKISPYESHLRYWPKGNRLLFVDSRGRDHAEFDLKTEIWKEVKPKKDSPCRLYGARSTWDTKRDLWVFRGNKEVCTYNPSTREYKRLPDTDIHGKGITYISTYDVYLASGPTGDDTRVYDPKTNKWKVLKGGPLKLVNGYLEFEPTTGLVMMVYQGSTFWLRFRP